MKKIKPIAIYKPINQVDLETFRKMRLPLGTNQNELMKTNKKK